MGPGDAQESSEDPDEPRLAEQGRPADYVKAVRSDLPAMRALLGRISRACCGKFGPVLGEDVAQEVLANLMTAQARLERAPALNAERDKGWTSAAVDALAAYALSRGAMISGFKAVFKGRGWEATGRPWSDGPQVSPGLIRDEDDVGDASLEEQRERFEEAHVLQKFWMGVAADLQRRYVGVDEGARRRAQFLRMLVLMASEDGCSPLAGDDEEEGVENRFLRGGGPRDQGIQLNSQAVLARLQDSFPTEGWTLDRVQVCWERLKRFIKQYRGAAVVQDSLGLRSKGN